MSEQPSPHFRLLGDLERTVMEHLWSTGPADAKAVHRAIGRERGITLNTVQSTLKRLQEKGILDRHKVSHAYIYEPRVDRQAFGRVVLGDVIGELMGGMDGRDGNTDAVISAISAELRGVVFILWGGRARKKAGLIDLERHPVPIESAHPRARANAHYPFAGSKPFTKANSLLDTASRDRVDWARLDWIPRVG